MCILRTYGVYDIRKLWRQIAREVFDIARCTAERLICDMSLANLTHGKLARTMVSEKAAFC